MSDSTELAKNVLHNAGLYNKEVIVLSSKVLADRVDILEKLIRNGFCRYHQSCGNCEQCLKIQELLK